MIGGRHWLAQHAPPFLVRLVRSERRWRRATLGSLGTPRLGVLAQYSPRPWRLAWPTRPERALEAPPRISLVTPSFNQGRFLERTIRSVLDQGYPNLDYGVQDGGSTDESVAVLERYASRLDRWSSEPDAGQAQAINRGFERASGEIMGWLNSDDLLLPGALACVARFFRRHPDVDVIYGHRLLIDEDDLEIGRWVMPPHCDEALVWADFVPQETLFWRRTAWEAVGAKLDESFQFALDWDLLLRLRSAGARFARVPRFLAAFRVHPRQKTSSELTGRGGAEIERLQRRLHGRVLSQEELSRALRGYLFRHLLHHHLEDLRAAAARRWPQAANSAPRRSSGREAIAPSRRM